VTGAIELERAAKKIGASLQAHPTLYAPENMLKTIADVPMEEVCIVSKITVIASEPPAGAFGMPDVPGVGAVIGLADGQKCQRCWKVLPDVGTHRHAMVCERCNDALDKLKPAAA